ncbi:MAG: coproporphyrinogen III oxidase, partial [Acetobacteraceae bacterium]|nr:coproporphyrinogen III oxidase [Acetobacteraceae bacterium]
MSAFGIYVHWPFCAAKCPYCDFNSHVRDRVDERAWAELIAAELRSTAELLTPVRQVTSIFFGGGTPSLMSPVAVERILDEVARLWPLSASAEITLEANPNSVEQERFRGYRTAGVNRISIGIQSLNDTGLRQLGRLHDAREAIAAIELAAATFPRTSFDLIYARPEQTAREWQSELQTALEFNTEHLSLYQLTIEPGTAFASLHRQGKLHLPDEDRAAEFFDLTQGLCESAGLPAYEVSNHARPGAECRHNLLYWRYGNYAGVGPGAHGRLEIRGRRMAVESERLPEKWAARIRHEGRGFGLTEIDAPDAASEHLLMNLRLREGLDLAEFEQRWGLSPSPPALYEFRAAGLIALNHSRLAVTERGRLVLNRIVSRLVD